VWGGAKQIGKFFQSIFLPFQAIISTFLFFRKKPPKKATPGGTGGSPKFCFTPNPIFVCDLKPHAKFQNPRITHSGRKVTGMEREKKERKKNASRLDQKSCF
jgi:hypothetical protein